MPSYPIPGFSEPFSSLSHLIGAGAFAILATFLVLRGRDAGSRALLSVFAFTCVLLLSMSGVYHLLAPGGTARDVLHRLDHAAIFGLIAGTFTPIHGILFRSWQRRLPLVVIWAAATTGICFRLVFFNSFPQWLGLLIYLLLGWLGLVSVIMVWRRFGRSAIALPLWGGVAYTAGAIVELTHGAVVIPGVIGPHELFHLAVLCGAMFFWIFMYEITTDAFYLKIAHAHQAQSSDQRGTRKDCCLRLALPNRRKATAYLVRRSGIDV